MRASKRGPKVARLLLLAAMMSLAAVDRPAAGAARADPAVAQGTAHQALFGVAFDGDRGVAVGALGELLESADGGRSWQAAAKGATALSLLGAGIRGERALAVGQQGLVLRREGSGPWAVVQSGSDQRLLAVGLNAQGLAVAVGAFGTVLVSEDGGQRWQRSQVDWTRYIDEPVEPHLYDVIVSDSGTVTLVGEYGLVLRSPDGGRSWVGAHRGQASLFDIELRSDGVGYAVGQEGSVLVTRDGGNVWSALPTGSKAVLLGVWSAPDGRVLVAGMREMLESRDGGQSWKARTDADFATAWYSGLAAPASGGLILVGHSGRIVKLGG